MAQSSQPAQAQPQLTYMQPQGPNPEGQAMGSNSSAINFVMGFQTPGMYNVELNIQLSADIRLPKEAKSSPSNIYLQQPPQGYYSSPYAYVPNWNWDQASPGIAPLNEAFTMQAPNATLSAPLYQFP